MTDTFRLLAFVVAAVCLFTLIVHWIFDDL